MGLIIKPILVIILFFHMGNLFSQDSINLEDRVYGLDQLLCNGKKYTFYPESSINGNQFLLSPDFVAGDVIIKGKRFENLSLNYDIYNQKLLLRYSDKIGTITIIEISKAWMEGFHLGKKYFECMNMESGATIFQVLGNGPTRIVYKWRKNLGVEPGKENLAFTRALKESFVLSGVNYEPFRNKRSLIAIFNPSHKREIRNYIHKNRIRLKKASDQVMTELINFIGNL